MAGRYLLDTNIVIAYFANETTVVNGVDGATEIFLPAAGIGELYYGAYKSNQVERNLSRLELFISQAPVLPCDLDTARLYGEIRNRLRAQGAPIPENDIWIAATALLHELTLATRDAHFQHINNLDLVAW